MEKGICFLTPPMLTQVGHLHTEVDDGDIRGVELVEHVPDPEVELLELYVVHDRVRDAAARELDVLEHALPLGSVVVVPVEIDDTCHVQLRSRPVGNGGFACNVINNLITCKQINKIRSYLKDTVV